MLVTTELVGGGADMAAMKQKAETFTNKAEGTVTASAGVDSTSENASVEVAAAAAASAACGQAAEADAKLKVEALTSPLLAAPQVTARLAAPPLASAGPPTAGPSMI